MSLVQAIGHALTAAGAGAPRGASAGLSLILHLPRRPCPGACAEGHHRAPVRYQYSATAATALGVATRRASMPRWRLLEACFERGQLYRRDGL